MQENIMKLKIRNIPGIKSFLVLAIALASAISLNSIQAGSTADVEMDSEIESKLARIKARQKLMRSNNTYEDSRHYFWPGGAESVNDPDRVISTTPCGAIDLGNVPNAAGVRNQREITIIIDGDIINADNHCR
jgi:hypothetical protein